ncbi:MAG: S-layer homology domain-containing protein [Clostridia bacterium]
MKSLNRTLSLVLVLVMVLGLVGISAGASFKDEAKINYKEAVDVMTGIGALVGYPDGTFNGTGTVTREEAVKTVVYAVLGADVAKTLAGTATGFADVDAGRWSSGVIAYAVSRGIINGRDAKTFDPTGNVTANEVGKMMLCAAGYGAKGEFIGSSWELNTAVLANKTGIFDDSKATNHSAPATREETALYTFNGILVPQVEYNAVFGSYVGKGQGITSAEGLSIMAEVYKTMAHAGPYTYSEGTKIGFNGEDGLGNPANVWTYQNKLIGAYAIDANVTYTAETKATAVEKGLKNYFLKPGGADMYVNGHETAGAIDSFANIADLTGNGTSVHVYIINNFIHRVVVVNKVLAKVALVDTKNENITLIPSAATAGYGVGGGTSIKTDVGYGKVKLGDYVVVATVDKNKDATIAGDTTIGYLAPVTKVEGKATAKSDADGTITVDGKVYEQAEGVASGYDLATFEVTGASNATLLLDANGYFLMAVPGSSLSADNIIAVTKNSNTLTSDNEVQPVVVGFNSKGETISLPCSDYDVATPGTIVAFTKGATGLYTFKVANTTNQSTKAFDKAFTIATDSIAKSDKVAVLGGSLGNLYYSADVKFIFAHGDIATKAVVANGVQKVDNATITYVYRQAGSTNEVFAVFVDKAPIATANSADQLIFLADIGGRVVGKDGKTYDSFSAVKGGMPVKDCYGNKDGLTEGLFYIANVNEKTGAYTLTAYTNADGLATTNASFPASIAVSAANAAANAFTIGSLSLDTSKAVMINLDTQELGSGAEMAATLKSIALGQKPGKFLAAFAIYNDQTGAASHVYYSVMDVKLTVESNTTAASAVKGITVASVATTTTSAILGDEITYTVTYSGTAAAGTQGKNLIMTFVAPDGTTLVTTPATVTIADDTVVAASTTKTFKVKVTSTTTNPIAAPTVSITEQA